MYFLGYIFGTLSSSSRRINILGGGDLRPQFSMARQCPMDECLAVMSNKLFSIYIIKQVLSTPRISREARYDLDHVPEKNLNTGEYVRLPDLFALAGSHAGLNSGQQRALDEDEVQRNVVLRKSIARSQAPGARISSGTVRPRGPLRHLAGVVALWVGVLDFRRRRYQECSVRR